MRSKHVTILVVVVIGYWRILVIYMILLCFLKGDSSNIGKKAIESFSFISYCLVVVIKLQGTFAFISRDKLFQYIPRGCTIPFVSLKFVAVVVRSSFMN